MSLSEFWDDRTARMAVGSIAVALLVMAIKYLAYLLTGSVALYSDALESIVNLVAAMAALVAVHVARKPADRRHPFGHHKAELVSAALEGALVMLAALLILKEAAGALMAPKVLTQPLAGMLVNAFASAINCGWALLLIRNGGLWRSPALVADGWHLMSDVATSAAVLGGIALVWLTGWAVLDPLLAAAVALHVLWAGYRIVTQSVSGLMDEAASPGMSARIRTVIASNGNGGLQVHDIRTRAAGRATFIEFHLVVPGEMTVEAAHAICDRLEAALEAAIEGADVVIHVEPDHKAKPVEGGAVVL